MFFENLWNAMRSPFSAIVNLFIPVERLAVPRFTTPEQAAEYLIQNCQYTGDPLKGAIDFTFHPEKLQYLMTKKLTGYYPIDCDDYACWAYAALRRIPSCNPYLVTLYGDRGAAHMICTYTLGTGGGTARYGVIDVNGHSPLSNIGSKTATAHFNSLYQSQNVSFSRASFSTYPF